MAHASGSIYSTAGMCYWNGRRKVGFLGLAMQIYDLCGLCPWTLAGLGGHCRYLLLVSLDVLILSSAETLA